MAVLPLAVNVAHALSTYGYAAIFAFVAVESIGVPWPGETMLIAAAVYAGATGKLTLGYVIAVAAGGAIVGDNIGYAIGRQGGWRLVRRFGRYVRLDDRKLKVGRYLFHRHGGKVVFFGRFVGVLRTYSAVLAGVNHMPFRRFLAFNASGGIVWAAIYSVGYYYAADLIESLGGVGSAVLIAISVLIALAGIVVVRRNWSRLEERAERALPGPLDAPEPRPDPPANAGG